MNEKFLKKIQYLSGALFMVEASQLICQFISGMAPVSFQLILTLIGTLLMAISMFTGMTQLLMAGAGIRGILFISMIWAIIRSGFKPYRLSSFLVAIVYVIVAIAAFQKKAASKYGLICTPLIFTGSMITYITQTQNPGIWPSIYFSLRNCVPTATCILLSCIVLEYLPQTSAAKTKKPLSDKSVNSDDRVEALTKLKQLLDSGVITQEEFETKKKQILGE